jgi:serine/threonine-protein kinase PpkA
MQAAESQPLPDIPGYRLERRLGEGGMAEVWAAIQVSLDRPVAIKLLSTDGRITPEMAARFEREARTIARLEHPRIVGIFDVGRSSDGRLYFAMPLLSNGDLGRRDLRFAPREVVRVLRAVLEALDFAHANGVIHRDVKPANILFDRDDRPLLADFGIALSRDGRRRVTSQRQTLGSSGYMSPEQARSGDVDARADLYSVGVVAFELLTGDLPFHGADALAVALAHIEQPVPRLPAQHGAWQPFIDRALAKGPEQRFHDARAMLAALDAVERALDAPPPAPEPVAAPAAPGARPPRAALLLLALLAAIALAWLTRHAPESDRAAVAAPAVDPARLAGLLESGEQRLAQGQWFTPEGDGAADHFLAALPSGDARARAGLERTLAAAADGAVARIEAGDGATAAETYDRAYAVAERSAIPDWPAWASFAARYAETAGKAFDTAAQRLDAARLDALAPALDRAAQVDRALAERRAALGPLPAPGARLREPGGPALVFVAARDGRRAFAIATTEVTRGDWSRFAAATRHDAAPCRDFSGPLALFARRSWKAPGFDQGDDHPVVCIGAADAEAYAAWLSQRTGARYRLPTRVEWATAIRGGATRACRDGNLRDAAARALRESHDCNDGHAHTAPVGRFAAGPLGLFDAAGNAAEWSADCLERADAGGCAERVVLGSSFRDGPRSSEAGRTAGQDPERGRPDLGFRLVRELAPGRLPPSAD